MPQLSMPLWVFIMSASIASCAPAGPVATRLTPGSTLVGYWALASFEDWDSAGNRSTPFGEHPRGYVQYTPSGRMTLQVARAPGPRPFAKGAEQGTAREKANAFDAYIAYFGTYTVDSTRHTVIHRVEADINPSFTGSRDPRPYRIAGDSLILGDGRTWRRVFLRVTAE